MPQIKSNIDFHVLNFTTLSIGILDDVLKIYGFL